MVMRTERSLRCAIFFFALLCVLLSSNVGRSEIKWIESLHYSDGWVRDVKIIGDYAFVMADNLHITNLNDTADTVIVNVNQPWDVVVSGDYAYVAANWGRLNVIDISDIKSPKIISRGTRRARDVAVVGKYAYVIYAALDWEQYTSRLEVIDISNPETLIVINSMELDFPLSMEIVGNFAYIAECNFGLRIIDISNPYELKEVSKLETFGSRATRLDIKNDYAYVVGRRLSIIDISDPYGPFLVSASLGIYEGWDVAVNGQYAFIAQGGEGYGKAGFIVADISDPHNPFIVDTFRGSFNTTGVDISGDYAYVADGIGGLHILDISDYSNSQPEAVCKDIELALDENGEATISADNVDGESYDPDGDPITLSIDESEFTCAEIGNNTVNLTVTDDSGAIATCEATVSVVDVTPPDVLCNAPEIIVPPDAPILFKPKATDNCDGSIVEITQYDCYKYTKKGKRIDKTESCIVEVVDDTIIIQDSGGVDNHITWNLIATDSSGNTAEMGCEILVVNPGHSRKK